MADTQMTNFVISLTPQQIETLQTILQEQGWEFSDFAYAHWKAKKDKVNIVAYLSGKVTLQGKGTSKVVEFIIEPQITGVLNTGEHSPEATEVEPHIGIDESGKGDYFGPLVIASCYVDSQTAPKLQAIGVVDSKLIKNDKKILQVATEIKKITHGNYNVIVVGNEAYNQLYLRCENLNRLLAWGHARTLENLLEHVPECPKAISDQFGSKGTVKKALMERGRKIILEEHPRAEADVAVAAASILARAEFVLRMQRLAEEYEVVLPKGASAQVEQIARSLVEKYGKEVLQKCAKVHFKTTEKVLA